jgi:hypothetical protein
VAEGVADRQRKDGSEHVAMVHGRVDGSEAGCEDMDASDVVVGEVAREMKCGPQSRWAMLFSAARSHHRLPLFPGKRQWQR